MIFNLYNKYIIRYEIQQLFYIQSAWYSKNKYKREKIEV